MSSLVLDTWGNTKDDTRAYVQKRIAENRCALCGGSLLQCVKLFSSICEFCYETNGWCTACRLPLFRGHVIEMNFKCLFEVTSFTTFSPLTSIVVELIRSGELKP